MPKPRKCTCGSNRWSYWENDARGIPLKRVCVECREEKLKGYRPEVLSDPNYDCDEPIGSLNMANDPDSFFYDPYGYDTY